MLKKTLTIQGVLALVHPASAATLPKAQQALMTTQNDEPEEPHNLAALIHGPQEVLFQDQSLFYTIGNIQYFTPSHHPINTLPLEQTSEYGMDQFQPIVIIPITKPDEGVLTVQHLRPIVEDYFAKDDVITKGYFKNVLLYHIDEHEDEDEEESPIDISLPVYLVKEFQTESIILKGRLSVNLPAPGIGLPSIPIHRTKGSFSETREIIEGPYLVKYHQNNQNQKQGQLELYPVFRLYPDIYKTFVNGIYPINDGFATYKTLNKVDQYGNLLIPVPSRLRREKGNQPSAGERVAVKDVYDIKGVPTSAGLRVYQAFRGDVNETASSVRKLDGRGAVIVGKVRTSPFAVENEVVEQTFDEVYPFSPRGDQYQSCGQASSGPACAVAAYDWLDFAIASDSGGSIREAAAIVGLYGNKPSRGIISTDGVLTDFNWTNTLGILARSPEKLKKVIEVWYGDSQANRRFNHLPKTLLVPSDDFPYMRKDIRNMVMTFLQDTERALGMTTEMITQNKSHPRTHPHHGNMMTITDFHNVANAWQWQNIGKPLVEAYEHINQGRFPPVGATLMDRWKSAREHPWSGEDFVVMKNKQIVAAEWFNGVIGRDEETCSKTIYAEPMELEEIPKYRESKLNFHNQTFLPIRTNPLFPSLPASISGAPHYVVPIGQVPFHSSVSDKEEMQTISMSLMAYPGCDFMLLDFINKLGQVGILKEVKTGRTAF
ncbi:uncharacterized protein I303_104332 [Kwoniella dejecticola CBS 10117]|uniref:Amidase domain-containing protein n=1 Tax=Kwoniella dejecticola CBS 10117 TaxID=1296121 RepID=A0A1A6A5M6_9TREE|nr:uncharacterized protein I303_04693 [Kwoniella dejecticola CBS 10117]OBR85358.1 hypothetical protein I303_04693 [Kwoniella dejecticola CBS 10117]